MEGFCKKHGRYEAEELEIFGIKIVSECPICSIQEQEQENKVQLALREEKRKEALKRRGIEPEYIGKTLEDYIPENESEREALERIRQLKEGNLKKVLLLGTNGVGKTLLACVLAQELNGIVTTMFEVSSRVRATYKPNAVQSEFDVLNEYLNYNFIAIDELGRTKGSDSELNLLSYLIDKAHTRGIRLLLISNKRLSKNLPADRRGEGIEAFLGNDTISRLRQSTAIVEIVGRDRRAIMAPS